MPKLPRVSGKDLVEGLKKLRDLYQKLMPLLEPRPEVEKRKIGFGAGG